MSQYKLNGNSTVGNEKRDDNGMLLAFDIINPPSDKQPNGSTLHFDLSEYSRKEESIGQNKTLRNEVYKAAQLLVNNVPAFTALSASVAESGAHHFLLHNPLASRFGIAIFPGVTTIEKADKTKPVVMMGNLDRLTDFSQIGYERHPKNYLDDNGVRQDLRPALMLLHELATASKDLQQWPLPLTFEGQRFGREQTIHNVMKAGFFVRDAIGFGADETPDLDELKSGNIPDKLKSRGYPEPTKIPLPEIKQDVLHEPSSGQVNYSLNITANIIFHKMVAENIANHLRLQFEEINSFNL